MRLGQRLAKFMKDQDDFSPLKHQSGSALLGEHGTGAASFVIDPLLSPEI
jgi:hypothetical protein